jgi:hypothetical protein
MEEKGRRRRRKRNRTRTRRCWTSLEVEIGVWAMKRVVAGNVERVVMMLYQLLRCWSVPS